MSDATTASPPRSAPPVPAGRAGYGVDLNNAEPIIVRAERRRGRIVYADTAADDPGFVRDLADGAPVAGGLSVRESIVRWLEAPFPSARKSLKVLPTLLDIQLPFPLDQCRYAFLRPEPTTDGKTRTLSVAARDEEIRRKLAAFAARGIDPPTLDHEGLALWTQSWNEAPEQRGSARIVVYLGEDRTMIAVGRDGRFHSSHSMRSLAAEPLLQILRAQLDPWPESFEWLWTGPGAEDSARVESIAAELGDNCPGPSRTPSGPRAFLARALAARVLRPGPLACNLRTGEFTHAAARRRDQRRATQTAGIYLLAGLLLCGGNLAARLAGAARLAQARGEVSELAASLAPGLTILPGDERRAVKQALDRRRKDAEPFLRFMQPSLTTRLQRIFEAAETYGMAFASLRLSEDSIALAGTANDWDDCDDLLAAVHDLGYAATLERRESATAGQLEFTVRGRLSP